MKITNAILQRNLRLSTIIEKARWVFGIPKNPQHNLTPPLPTKITIDSSSVCNLACPLCATGTKTINLSQAILKPDDFSSFISQFPHLNTVALYNWGEPLLNPHIIEILEIAKSHHITTCFDTNFSLNVTDAFLLKIIRSGLGTLRVSLDGASQKTYQTYRQNGSFKLAYTNMKRLRQLQKENNTSFPQIYWKFLVHKYNEHEIEKAKQLAEEIDVAIIFDGFQLAEDIVDVNITPNQTLKQKKQFWLTTKNEYLSPYYQPTSRKTAPSKTTCPWLFSSLSIHPDGTVLPCCYVASETSSMGNIHHQTIEAIWHSQKYQYARSLFLEGSKIRRIPVVCEHCPIYKRNG